MKLEEKYTMDSKESDKTLIPIETYAMCELLQEISNKLDRLLLK